MKCSAQSLTTSQYSQLNFTSNEHESIHGLIDVACEVPVVLERLKTLIASQRTVQVQWRGELFKSSLTVNEKLHERHRQYSSKRPKPLYWAEPSSMNNAADDPYGSKLFPFALHFESFETATQMILWWGMSLQILGNMLDLYRHSHASSTLSLTFDHSRFENLMETEPFSNPRFLTVSSVKEEADKLARYLCQSVEYCYKIENGTIGPQMTTYAQWGLKSYFRKFHHERELSWCLNIKNMKGPGFHNGVELMGFQVE